MNVCYVRSTGGAEIFSGHYLVRAKIRLKIKRRQKIKKSEIKKQDAGKLNTNDTKEEIIEEVTANGQNTQLEEVEDTKVGTLIVATIYLQLIQNRYMFRSFTILQCSHQHCVQPIASDVEVVGYLQQRLLC